MASWTQVAARAVFIVLFGCASVACSVKVKDMEGEGAARSREERTEDEATPTQADQRDPTAGRGPISPCAAAPRAIVRDFREDHPDFEGGEIFSDKGIVAAELGPDGRPVYAHPDGSTSTTSGMASFDQWYRTIEGTNVEIPVDLPFDKAMDGDRLLLSYNSDAFFPIDEQGFGNEGHEHNFHFTMEMHTEFDYRGGEVFSFSGDDDLWVFVNGKLAIDLGGVHEIQSDSIDFDARAEELGIVPGSSYTLDLFFAERHTFASNFNIETSIKCFRQTEPSSNEPQGTTVADAGEEPPMQTETGDPADQVPQEVVCNAAPRTVVRDFREDHPDFEGGEIFSDKGIVAAELGPDGRPVYAHPDGSTSTTSGMASFDQWYRTIEGTNVEIPVDLPFDKAMDGDRLLLSYNSDAFFPIDEQGFGNEGHEHNFHFTMEMHTEFDYRGGEVFSFSGDDDLWVFVNGKLAIDLGGVHEIQSDSIDFDARAEELGIVPGSSYTLDLFFAERHTFASNFNIETSIKCFRQTR